MRDPLHGTLSVVIPTYNCRPLLERHIAEMAAWLDLADEIIVVDSRSKDGTREILRKICFIRGYALSTVTAASTSLGMRA